MLECDDLVLDVVYSGGDDVFKLCLKHSIEQVEMLLRLFVLLFIQGFSEFFPAMDEGAEGSLEDKSLKGCCDAFLILLGKEDNYIGFRYIPG